MFVLGHLSDVHLAPLPTPRVRDLRLKRVLGFLNWLRSRRMRHRAWVLDRIVGDMQAAAPNHIALTGDLVNIATADEYIGAQQWLSRLGPPDRVTLVPGNHDIYVRSAIEFPQRYWGEYLRGDDIPSTGKQAEWFPFVRRDGPLALIGTSSGVPTAPLMASGELGAGQLARLADMLSDLGREKLFRVVLIHHPVPPKPKNRLKRLVDAAAFRDVIAKAGAELILHGHDHVHSLIWIDGPNGRIPVVGVPSASAVPHGDHEPAAYNLYVISGEAGRWRCEMISRGLRRGHDDVVEQDRRLLIGLLN